MRKTIVSFGVMIIILAYACFADTCPDFVCDLSETYLSCPEDCHSGSFDSYCDGVEDGICDADCDGNDHDCPGYEARSIVSSTVSGEDNRKGFIGFVLVLFVLGIIGLVVYLTHRQKDVGYIAREHERREKQIQARNYSLAQSNNQGSGQVTKSRLTIDQDPFKKYDYLLKK